MECGFQASSGRTSRLLLVLFVLKICCSFGHSPSLSHGLVAYLGEAIGIYFSFLGEQPAPMKKWFGFCLLSGAIEQVTTTAVS